MGMHVGCGVKFHALLIWKLDKGTLLASCRIHFYSRDRFRRNHCMRDLMCPSADPYVTATRIILAFPRNLGRVFQTLICLGDAKN